MTSGKTITIEEIATALMRELDYPEEDVVTIEWKQILTAMRRNGLTVSWRTCREKTKVLERAGLLKVERNACLDNGYLIYDLDVKALRAYLTPEATA